MHPGGDRCHRVRGGRAYKITVLDALMGSSANLNGAWRIREAQTGKDNQMMIGEQLRAIREQKKLSQGEIEKRTGLLRCYISRVENGHTVPAIETLEKFAHALEVPLYQLFYDSDKPPALPHLVKRKTSGEIAWGSSGKEARMFERFRQFLSRSKERDRKLLLYMAQKLARGKARPEASAAD
jgi:transcriptional regulator with XRE-family HTH domain